MVIASLVQPLLPESFAVVAVWLFWAEEEMTKPAILRMSGETRARVLAVLAGLIILGLGMILLTWLGARMTRRYMNRGAGSGVRSDTAPTGDEWAKKPLSGEPADQPSGEND